MKTEEILKEYGINLQSEKIEKLELFINRLIEKNRIVNLISQNDISDIHERHLLDSLIILKSEKLIDILSRTHILDIGSGGGFPGIVLAIVFDNSNFILSESNRKKYEFLLWIKEILKLKNTELINERITEFHKNKYPVIIQRAAGNYSEITRLALKLLLSDGYFISWVSQDDATRVKKEFNVDFIYNYNLRCRERCIVAIKNKAGSVEE